MFGSIGVTELIVIFVVALLVIGPKRLPDLAKTLGKALRDFKRATSDFQDSLSLEDDYDLEPTKPETTASSEPDPNQIDPHNDTSEEKSSDEDASGEDTALVDSPDSAEPSAGKPGESADEPPRERSQAT